MTVSGKTTKPRTARTSATRSTTAKPTTPSTKADSVKKTVVVSDEAAGETTAPQLRKKELIERVVLRSGIKKRDAKPVIEAMLEELGACIAEGRDLILPPMGRMKITRQKETPNGQVTMIRSRRKPPAVHVATLPAKDPD